VDTPLLEVRDLCHRYGAKPVLRGVSLRLARGELACLLGPSGCGKTTLLRLVAGFESPASGSIEVQGELLSDAGRVVPPERRRMGMVFQDFALFPHLDVADNVAFGLAHLPATQRAHRVQTLLALVDMAGAGSRFPHQLSGGQQQRVALARALAPQPALVLLDEPFSGLDESLREHLASEVRAILVREGSTALMVTHDQHEAFALADAVGVMNDGRIEQWGSAEALYHEPATRFVAEFVGEGALLPGRAAPDGVHTALGLLGACGKFPHDSPVEVLLRPDDLTIDSRSPYRAVVEAAAFRGAHTLHRLCLDSGQRVFALADRPLAVGSAVGLTPRSGRPLRVFPAAPEIQAEDPGATLRS